MFSCLYVSFQTQPGRGQRSCGLKSLARGLFLRQQTALYNECKNRFLDKWHWHCFLLDQSDDRFHLLLCTRKQWHPRFERVVPDWKTWVTTVRLHYVSCFGDRRVDGVHRYLRIRIYADIVRNCALYSWSFTVDCVP